LNANRSGAEGIPRSVSGATRDHNVGALLAQATHLLKAGRPADAVVPLREAARWLPGNAAILHDLGLACLECGQINDAIEALRASVALDPGFQDSYLKLGIALEAAGSADGALAAYQKAAELKPLPEATYRAANLLDTHGHAPQASEMFRRAAADAAKTTLGRLAMARALLVENRDGEAEKVLRKVLEAERHNPVALELLANTLADAGRFADARRYFLRAIEQAPWLAGCYYDVVRCGRVGLDDAAELMTRMRAVLESSALDPAQRVRVHLALGKTADDLGNPEEAMRHFDAAEAVRNSIVRFDLQKFEARVDRLIAHFTPELFAQAAAQASASANSDRTPILILGLPRSGTTLVEQILSAHPDVSGAGELSYWNERGSEWERVESPEAKAELQTSSAKNYVQLLRTVTAAERRKSREAPGARRGITTRPVQRVTDKMPLNFQWAGLIHLALPHATLVHCRRNPLDTALSIHQTHFNPRLLFPTGGAALVGFIRAYQRLCAHWRRVLPPTRFIEIDYEKLVNEPQPAIRRILDAAGLAWSDSCLFPERNARAVKTPSKWQARQPIYRHAIGRWHAYENFLGPLASLRD
jgi:tetratricopeptide (TPR) repeat protein